MPRTARAERALQRLGEVGLGPELAARYPHQLSGGQLQRAVIARALVVDPSFVVCDEPVSALDVTVQGQIVSLLDRIRSERGLASLFISHNLAVVARLCARVLVMYRGRIVESGARANIISAPLHPYTRVLVDAVPAIDPGARRRLSRVRHCRGHPRSAHGRTRGASLPRAARMCCLAAAPSRRRCAPCRQVGRLPAIAPTSGQPDLLPRIRPEAGSSGEPGDGLCSLHARGAVAA